MRRSPHTEHETEASTEHDELMEYNTRVLPTSAGGLRFRGRGLRCPRRSGTSGRGLVDRRSVSLTRPSPSLASGAPLGAVFVGILEACHPGRVPR
jgi:hypothetical protein